tara:strand:- start:673 stop:1224 length:552 start_codon:yes stop_codon:yes gene_type:complete
MYKAPDVESSYKKNNLGKDIYDTVIELNPKVIVEFGILHGYSTLAMSQALKDLNNNGKIISYDLFENYKYKHGTMEEVTKLLEANDLQDFVELRYGNLYEWIEKPDECDLLHIDIANDGDIISLVADKFNDTHILFEGGSEDRDSEWWMKEYKRTHMYPLKEKLNYEILNSNWPSISLIRGTK